MRKNYWPLFVVFLFISCKYVPYKIEETNFFYYKSLNPEEPFQRYLISGELGWRLNVNRIGKVYKNKNFNCFKIFHTMSFDDDIQNIALHIDYFVVDSNNIPLYELNAYLKRSSLVIDVCLGPKQKLFFCLDGSRVKALIK